MKSIDNLFNLLMKIVSGFSVLKIYQGNTISEMTFICMGNSLFVPFAEEISYGCYKNKQQTKNILL